MKRLYRIYDDDGEIYAAYKTEAEARKVGDPVVLLPNFTCEQADYTDESGDSWIAVEHLAKAFSELVDATGMKKKALAEICGKTPTTFCNYLSGKAPVPPLVWERVAQFKR